MSDVRSLLHRVHAELSSADLVYGHGTDNAWDEAVALVLDSLSLPHDPSSLSRPVGEAQRILVNERLKRRMEQRLPTPYLTGWSWFCGRRFHVEEGVIIPRSPIAELIGDGFVPWLRRDPHNILDLCCGSGCIGIAAAHAFPTARLTLADVDSKALALARRNVVAHELEARVTVVRSDLFAKLGDAVFDLVLCNPPYVAPDDMAELPPEYVHEPATALAGGGRDGLALMVRCLGEAVGRVSPQGLFVGEVGQGAARLQARLPQTPFIWPALARGGEGVFVLDGEHLTADTAAPSEKT